MPIRKRHAIKCADEFEDICREFFNYLTYTRNYFPATCYAYSSDLSVWCEWGADKPKRPQRMPVWLNPEEQGVLEELLSHADVSTTLIYTRVSENRKRELVSKL